jgi:hypothetical protein
VLRNTLRHTMRITDISSKGVKLSGACRFEAGDLVDVDLGYTTVQAKVAWRDDQGCGLVFTQPIQLDRFLEASTAPGERPGMAA